MRSPYERYKHVASVGPNTKWSDPECHWIVKDYFEKDEVEVLITLLQMTDATKQSILLDKLNKLKE